MPPVHHHVEPLLAICEQLGPFTSYRIALAVFEIQFIVIPRMQESHELRAGTEQATMMWYQQVCLHLLPQVQLVLLIIRGLLYLYD
jgi:hypothetical protein